MEYVRAAGRVWGKRMAEQGRPPRTRRPKGPRGLWLVQLVEYLLGVALGLMVPRTPDVVVMAISAVALVANAATLRAGLAAFPLTSPPVHRRIGIGLSVAIALAAIVVPMASTTRPTLLLFAFGQGFISVRFGHGFRTTRS